MEFFAAGASYRERCFMAANRIGKCSTVCSQIETPDGTFTVGDLFARGEPFDVYAWDGSSKVVARASAPFRKAERELCVRIEMSDGRSFEAALGHRILTADGWLLVGDYVQLSRLQGQLQPCPVLTSWGYGPSVRRDGCTKNDDSGSTIDLGRNPLRAVTTDGTAIATIVTIGTQELYDFSVPKYKNYIAAGLVHHNTEGAGGYETALHLTGCYPQWWEGKRFDQHVRFWVAGKTNETTRDIVQTKLFGEISYASGRKGFSGTGLVPGDLIGDITWKQGVQDLADTVKIKHASGGWSKVGLKSYQQGRGSFEGTEQDGIWLDEEPPSDIYGECLIRTATTQGIIYATFTPLEGMSEMAMSFLPNGQVPTAEDV